MLSRDVPVVDPSNYLIDVFLCFIDALQRHDATALEALETEASVGQYPLPSVRTLFTGCRESKLSLDFVEIPTLEQSVECVCCVVWLKITFTGCHQKLDRGCSFDSHRLVSRRLNVFAQVVTQTVVTLENPVREGWP